MRATKNVDTLLFQHDTLFGPTMTVATFHPKESLLEVHDGCAKYLANVLAALRKHQKENNQPVLPVRVEYW